MNTNIELKEEISVDEYKAWLTGLLRGKGSQLPDLKDWRAIKKMTDKIVPDVVETTPWTIAPTYVPPATFDTPSPNWWENQPTCGGTGAQDGDNLTIRNNNSSITFNNAGSISIGTTCTSQTNGVGARDIIAVSESYTGQQIPARGIVINEPAVGGHYGGYGVSHASSYAPSELSLDDYKFDTSKYMIATAEGEDLSTIAKLIGVKK